MFLNLPVILIGIVRLLLVASLVVHVHVGIRVRSKISTSKDIAVTIRRLDLS